MREVEADEQERLLAVLERNRDQLEATPGVHYVDVGYKYVDGQPTDQLAIRLHVHEKLPEAQLAPGAVAPIEIEGVPVDVLQTNPEPHQNRNGRFDPLVGGVGTTNSTSLAGFVGTLGAVVFDEPSGAAMALSNHHVYVGAAGRSGDNIAQPSTTAAADVIGTVTRWDLALDCAVGTLAAGRGVSTATLGLSPGVNVADDPRIGMAVGKSGRTTGVTFGVVDGVSANECTVVPDPARPAPNGEISMPGDSGSVWVRSDVMDGGIGLHYAGESDPNPAAERAWAKNLVGVANTLNIRFRREPVFDAGSDPLSVVAWGPNRLDVFGVASADMSSAHKWWPGSSWRPSPTGWESLGGALTSPPVYVSWGPNRLDGFAMGNDRGLWHQAYDGRGWSGWETMHGGEMRSKPAAVCWGANRIDLFAVGRDRDLQHAAWDGVRWSGWESLGGVLISAPTVVSWGPGRLDVFAQGTDNALWHRWWDGARWGGWESLGGSISGQPEAVCWGPNRIDVFAVGAQSNDMLHLWYENRWGPWESLGGVLRSPPTAVSWDANRLDVFAIGTDGAMSQRWWDGSSWGGWARLGSGPFASRAAAVSWAPGRLDVFARRANDQALAHVWFDSGRWGPWESLGGILTSGWPKRR